MNTKRILAFLPLALLALIVPSMGVDILFHGHLELSHIFGMQSGGAGYWDSWLATMAATFLVYVWFLWPLQKRFLLHAFSLVVVAIGLQMAPAKLSVLALPDAFALNAFSQAFAVFSAVLVVMVIRSVRRSLHAPSPQDSLGDWLIFVTQVILSGGSFVGTLACLLVAFEGARATVLFGWMGTFVLLWVGVVIHEAGHYFGARFAGMTVLHVRVAAWEFHPRRGRWLIRWAPQREKKYGGWVYAVHDHRRPMRPQMLQFIVAGPLINFVVGALSLSVCWFWVEYQTVVGVAGAFAVTNIVMGVVNLLPRKGRIQTDGWKLLHWWRHSNDMAPELTHARLVSLSVFGTTADALPEDDIKYLAGRPMPIPLAAAWYRLKAAQNRGDWEEALSQGEKFEKDLSSLSQVPRSLHTLIALVRTEVAFSQVMATGELSTLRDELLPSDASRLTPSLWPRCLALRASLSGNQEESARLLAVSMEKAKQSPDLALAKSETILAAYVLKASERPARLSSNSNVIAV
jgi:hypothetical protein